MIKAIQIALSGMNAASRKVDAVAGNVANLTTTGALDPADGPAPYNAVTAVQSTVTGANRETLGVKSDIVPANRPYIPAYDPDSPHANADGLIGAPNVDLAEEAVNLSLAETAYKANIKTIQTASDMMDDLLKIFDRKV